MENAWLHFACTDFLSPINFFFSFPVFFLAVDQFFFFPLQHNLGLFLLPLPYPLKKHLWGCNISLRTSHLRVCYCRIIEESVPLFVALAVTLVLCPHGGRSGRTGLLWDAHRLRLQVKVSNLEIGVYGHFRAVDEATSTVLATT